MPQNSQSITQSPEFKQFCKDNNLEVSNIESINLMFYTLKRENNELREMLMEVAKNTIDYNMSRGAYPIESLFDKWNNK